MIPTRTSRGATCFRTSRRLPYSGPRKATPVTLPPGCATLATSRCCTGKATLANTTGIVDVASRAARVAWVPAVQITSTFSFASSRARLEICSEPPSAQRVSMTRFRPSR